MEEIPTRGCIKPCKYWDKLFINWCRILPSTVGHLASILRVSTRCCTFEFSAKATPQRHQVSWWSSYRMQLRARASMLSFTPPKLWIYTAKKANMTLENPPFSIGYTSAMLVFGGVWSIHIYLDTSTPAFRKASKKRASRTNSGEVSIHSWNWHSQKQQFFAIMKVKTGCWVHSVKTKIEKC